MPTWKETRFPCNALVRNQNILKIPTHKNIMSQIVNDNLAHVMKKLNKQ